MASEAVTRLTEEVAEAKTVNASARTLIAGLAERVRAVAGDEAATLALATELDAENAAMAQAVADGTIAEGEPTPTEPGGGEPV